MHETLDITDPDMGITVTQPQRPDPTRDSAFTDSTMTFADFFSRPIIAATYIWTPNQGAPFGATFNPWSLYYGNPRVANRISNFNLLTSKLHVKFVINGSSFYYGLLMADYAPLSSMDDVTGYNTLDPVNAIQASQRTKVFIDPTSCCTTQLDLPFVWYKDAVSLPSGDLSKLGTVNIRELNGLKHSNGATQPINITVFIWASDVKLAGPTLAPIAGLVPQAGDEYSTSPVSTPATAVAKIARMFTHIPVIGPFATATSIVMDATSAVAKMFGFSRPINVAPLTNMRPTYMSSLAVTNAPDTSEKLTVDIKQELTIDSNVIGVNLDDEMTIAGIAARETYLTTFPWTVTRAYNDLLWNTPVTPINSVTSGGAYYLPACTFAAFPFQYWRGKMRYRFQVVSSAHHRGRLRVVWDPAALVGPPEVNVQISKIIDISTDKDVTVEVDWGNDAHYCSLGNLGTNFSTLAAYSVPAPSSFNGVIGVYVLNDLATPNSAVNNDISVNVYISCNELEVAAPRDIPQGLLDTYSYTVQAGEENAVGHSDMGCGSSAAEHTFGNVVDDDHDALVYFGERIVSFRQLLKRYSYHHSLFIVNPSATLPSYVGYILPDRPIFRGYSANSITVTATAKKFNYVAGTMQQYVSLAFLAVRGSQRVKYLVQSGARNVTSLSVTRGSIGLSIGNPIVAASTTLSTFMRAATAFRGTMLKGAAIVPSANQPVLEVELPFYSRYRFQLARMLNNPLGAIVEWQPAYWSHFLELEMGPGTTPVIVDKFVATGEDFSLIWFQGCPPLYSVGTPP